MSEPHIIGQQPCVAFVKDVVIEMRQESTLGFEIFDDNKSLFETKVCRMGFDADAIEHEDVEITQAVHRGGRDGLEVSRVRKIVKSIGDNGQFAVGDLQRRDYEVFANTERRIGLNGVRYQLWQAAAKMRWLKYVLKYPPQVGPGYIICVNTHRTIAKIQRPNIVKAKNVIDMAMRKQYGIKVANVSPKGLLTEIDRGVDKYPRVEMLDEN